MDKELRLLVAGVRNRPHNWQEQPTETQTRQKAEREGVAQQKANKNRIKVP